MRNFKDLSPKKQDKRREHNCENLYKFFATPDKFKRPRSGSLKVFPPKLMLEIIQMIANHEAMVEHLGAYVRRFRQAAGELNESDVEQAVRLLDVKMIMES